MILSGANAIHCWFRTLKSRKVTFSPIAILNTQNFKLILVH